MPKANEGHYLFPQWQLTSLPEPPFLESVRSTIGSRYWPCFEEMRSITRRQVQPPQTSTTSRDACYFLQFLHKNPSSNFKLVGISYGMLDFNTKNKKWFSSHRYSRPKNQWNEFYLPQNRKMP